MIAQRNSRLPPRAAGLVLTTPDEDMSKVMLSVEEVRAATPAAVTPSRRHRRAATTALPLPLPPAWPRSHLRATHAPHAVARAAAAHTRQVPVPKPRSGELLIKVAAAPINPSDYGVWRNSKPERCPLAIGNEGSGVVVASGGGSARIVAGVGTKVGFVNPVSHKGLEPRPSRPQTALLLTRLGLAMDSTRSSASWTRCST